VNLSSIYLQSNLFSGIFPNLTFSNLQNCNVSYNAFTTILTPICAQGFVFWSAMTTGTGSFGTTGTTRTTGSTGTSGTTGSTGTTGINGTSTTGTTGINGTSTTGTTGINGTSTTGTTGINGTSGSSTTTTSGSSTTATTGIPCVVGTVNCPCGPNNQCFSELICISNVCSNSTTTQNSSVKGSPVPVYFIIAIIIGIIGVILIIVSVILFVRNRKKKSGYELVQS